MKLRLLKSGRIKALYDQIASNLQLYRSGDFEYLTADPSGYIEIQHEIDDARLMLIKRDDKDDRDAENCKIMFEALKSISPYLARDERLWIYMIHTSLLAYVRKRWPIPSDDEEAVRHIRKHFFIEDTRGFETSNAASRLWWISFMCSRVKDFPLETALKVFLHVDDFRAAVAERPTTALSPQVFSSILKVFNDSYNGDKKLFNRKIYRPLMVNINLIGGVKLIETMDEGHIKKIVIDNMPAVPEL